MNDIQTANHVDDGVWNDEEDVVVRPARFGGVSELPVLRNIVDVTMVGLLGGGPILAIRAARVFLEDSYAARNSSAERELTYAGRHSNDD
jgi:hypothetical protein